MDAQRQVERLLRQARSDPEVLGVILFGSAARGDSRPTSDIDVCLVLTPHERDALELSRRKLSYTKNFDVDVQVFQQLPLYVRQRVLQEGRVLFTRDEDALYELAYRTVRAFERFKRVYHQYLDEVARAGP